jgi:maleate isomerase
MSKLSTSLAGAAADAREYGRAGLYGLLTPQGNPTAEPEMRILLPPQSSMLCARLTSRGGDLRRRLTDYFERLSTFIDQFDDIAFDAVGFACTGSSYGLAAQEERIQLAGIETRKGYPVVTAAGAVEQALEALAIQAIALVSPYPAWLTDACRAHWERRGVRVTASLQLPPASPAQPIYAHTTAALLERVERFDTHGAEAMLLTGTGMPSLRALQPLEAARGVPVLSSNLCLAWALTRTAGRAQPGPESRLYGGWSSRLAIS